METVSAVTPMIVCSPVRGIFATFGDGVIRIWVYKHYCPGSTNIPVDSNLIDGCDFERRQPFDQILADMKRTLNTTLLTMAPLWRRHIINKLIENERIIFLAEKYWQLVLHLTKDEELTRSFINSVRPPFNSARKLLTDDLLDLVYSAQSTVPWRSSCICGSLHSLSRGIERGSIQDPSVFSDD